MESMTWTKTAAWRQLRAPRLAAQAWGLGSPRRGVGAQAPEQMTRQRHPSKMSQRPSLDSQRGDKWEDSGSGRAGRPQGLAGRPERPDCVVVPTDKTDSFVTMGAVEYAEEMINALSGDAVEVDRGRLVDAHSDAMQTLQDLEPGLDREGRLASKECLDSRAVPSPTLLIKDHKKKVNGRHPVRLIIPATNFVSIFDKAGCPSPEGD